MSRLLCLAVLATMLVAVYAGAQNQTTTPQTTTPPAAQNGDQKMIEQQMQQLEQKRQTIKQRVTSANLPEARRMQAMHVFGAVVMPMSTAHVLALRDELELTDDQVTQLRRLVVQSLNQTRQILTEEQRAQLQQLQPTTVYDAAQQMMPVLHGKPNGAAAPATPPPATAPAQPPAANQ